MTEIIYTRVPETIVLLLAVLATVALGTVGYGAGLARHRSILTATVLVFVPAAVYTLVVDLGRPREGFLLVSQQPLIDLQRQVGPPS